VKQVYFGASNEKFGGVAFNPQICQMPPRPYSCTGGLLADEAVGLLKRFYDRGNENIPPEKRHRAKKEAKSALEVQKAGSSL
jgi:hypothetical protein